MLKPNLKRSVLPSLSFNNTNQIFLQSFNYFLFHFFIRQDSKRLTVEIMNHHLKMIFNVNLFSIISQIKENRYLRLSPILFLNIQSSFYYFSEVLQTLSGRDPETRPDVAFSLLQSKMQYSESKNIWNYLVKNLVLLDRCAEDRSFVSDIATLHILHVENYRDPDPKNSKH